LPCTTAALAGPCSEPATAPPTWASISVWTPTPLPDRSRPMTADDELLTPVAMAVLTWPLRASIDCEPLRRSPMSLCDRLGALFWITVAEAGPWRVIAVAVPTWTLVALVDCCRASAVPAAASAATRATAPKPGIRYRRDMDTSPCLRGLSRVATARRDVPAGRLPRRRRSITARAPARRPERCSGRRWRWPDPCWSW